MSGFLRLFALLPLAVLPISLPSCTYQKGDGGVYKTTNEGGDWVQNAKIEGEEKKNLATADTLDLLTDPNNSAVVFWLVEGTGLFVSNNFGDSWKRIIPETSTVYSMTPERGERGVFYLAAQLGNRSKILKTENGGVDWREIYTESGENSQVTQVAGHPFVPNMVFAVNTLGLLTASTDGGLTWRAVYSFENEAVKSLAVDEEKSGVLWVLTDRGVWKSEDNGLKFVKIDLGEYNSLGNQLYLLRKNVSGVFISTEKGLFRSQDEGMSWKKVATLNDPETNPITDLTLIGNGQRNAWAATAGMALYLSFDEGVRWKPIQFEISRGLNKIIIKRDDPRQFLVGVTSTKLGNSLGLKL